VALVCMGSTWGDNVLTNAAYLRMIRGADVFQDSYLVGCGTERARRPTANQ